MDNLLNSKGVNEVYLLSIISAYYMDVMIFKSKDAGKLDSKALYSKYKIWGERDHLHATTHGFLTSIQQYVCVLLFLW